MVREIMHDEKFLSQKAEPATKNDMDIAQDLADTLICYRYKCVGLAANMIGVNKAIIAIKPEEATEVLLMFNPKITKKSAKTKKVEEGCLSLAGHRETIRYESIEITYRDKNWQKMKDKYSGWTAQIIQHEMDHLAGILI